MIGPYDDVVDSYYTYSLPILAKIIGDPNYKKEWIEYLLEYYKVCSHLRTWSYAVRVLISNSLKVKSTSAKSTFTLRYSQTTRSCLLCCQRASNQDRQCVDRPFTRSLCRTMKLCSTPWLRSERSWIQRSSPSVPSKSTTRTSYSAAPRLQPGDSLASEAWRRTPCTSNTWLSSILVRTGDSPRTLTWLSGSGSGFLRLYQCSLEIMY